MTRRGTVTLALAAAFAIVVFASGASAQGVNPFGKAGADLTRKDLDLMRENARALLNKKSDTPMRLWSNPESGRFGGVAIGKEYTDKGYTCHKVTHIIDFKDIRKQFVMPFCLVNGQWKIAF